MEFLNKPDRDLPLTHGKGDDAGNTLASWENEGGAPRSSWMDDRYQCNVLADAEDEVLRRLGAGVVAQWNDLPTGVQRAVFERATATGDLQIQHGVKERIARFLHARAGSHPGR